jgi:hypothetical protein
VVQVPSKERVKSEKLKSKDCTAKIDMLSSSVLFFQPERDSSAYSLGKQIQGGLYL